MEQETLLISPIFKGLTKSVTIMGVDYNYFLLNFVFAVILFINSSSFLLPMVCIPLHFLGVILCKLDPHIFQLISVRATIGATKNKSLWRCQSYEAY